MRLVTLYEFQRKYLHSLRAEGISVTPVELQRFFDVINRTYGREGDVLSMRYDTKREDYYIQTNGSVGFTYYFGKTPFMIQILPKPYRNDRDQRQSMALFLSLLNLSGSLGMSTHEINSALSRYESEDEALHELFFYLYILQLEKEAFHGMYQEYMEVEGETKTIRGRLLLSKLVKNGHMQGNVPVRYAVLGADNPLNRVLRAALEVVAENSTWRGIKRAAEHLSYNFRDVSSLRDGDMKAVRFNPLNERFKPLYTIATMILFGFKKAGAHGTLHPGIFLDMARLFEDLVYHTVKRALREEATVHQWHLLPHVIKDARKVEGNLGAVFMFGRPLPDIMAVTPFGGCVIEVKYRNLLVRLGDITRKKLVRNSSELYQIYTYSRLSGGSAAIVYPRLSGSYNEWIPDMFGEDVPSIQFFDGTRFGLFGYELSRIGKDIFVTKNGVILRENVAENLREHLMFLCGAGKGKDHGYL